jgi:MerR family transcriptional regulator, light-induced transcriptional regulator
VKRHSNSPAALPAGLPQEAGLAILRAIGRGRRTVSEIIGRTGLSQSNVSNHLARFRARQWVQAERRGREIYYRIIDSGIVAYIEQTERAGGLLSEAERGRLLDGALAAYIDATKLSRPEVAEQVIGEALDAGLAWQELCTRVFVPALRRVGELWEQRELSVAAEHAATAFTERIMSRLVPRRLPPDCPPLGRVVVGCVAGERHALGARMVADFFLASGWRVGYLGADVPTEDLLGFVRAQRPDIVALSVTVDAAEDSLRQAINVLSGLRGDASRPLLIGGGQWFDRHPEQSLALDLCGGELPSVVVEAGRRLPLEEE